MFEYELFGVSDGGHAHMLMHVRNTDVRLGFYSVYIHICVDLQDALAESKRRVAMCGTGPCLSTQVCVAQAEGTIIPSDVMFMRRPSYLVSHAPMLCRRSGRLFVKHNAHATVTAARPNDCAGWLTFGDETVRNTFHDPDWIELPISHRPHLQHTVHHSYTIDGKHRSIIFCLFGSCTSLFLRAVEPDIDPSKCDDAMGIDADNPVLADLVIPVPDRAKFHRGDWSSIGTIGAKGEASDDEIDECLEFGQHCNVSVVVSPSGMLCLVQGLLEDIDPLPLVHVSGVLGWPRQRAASAERGPSRQANDSGANARIAKPVGDRRSCRAHDGSARSPVGGGVLDGRWV